MKSSQINHYQVLGLISAGTQGTKLSQRDITNAYRLKALELHPDKHPHDPNAKSNFQRLNSSYQILADEKSRKWYDQFLILKHQDIVCKHAPTSSSPFQEKYSQNFKPGPKPCSRRRASYSPFHGKYHRNSSHRPTPYKTAGNYYQNSSHGQQPYKSMMAKLCLKVFWDASEGRCDYTVDRLKNLFAPFGQVGEVHRNPPTEMKMTANVYMTVTSQTDTLRAIGKTPLGDPSNPLLVIPWMWK